MILRITGIINQPDNMRRGLCMRGIQADHFHGPRRVALIPQSGALSPPNVRATSLTTESSCLRKTVRRTALTSRRLFVPCSDDPETAHAIDTVAGQPWGE
jgi:hypothetical protein